MNSKESSESARREGKSDLAGQYGCIGISAVAAALRYQGEAKNPRYAPATPKDNDYTDVAA
jgi:hypothetical protein